MFGEDLQLLFFTCWMFVIKKIFKFTIFPSCWTKLSLSYSIIISHQDTSRMYSLCVLVHAYIYMCEHTFACDVYMWRKLPLSAWTLCMKVGTIIFVLQLWTFSTSKQNQNSKRKRRGKKETYTKTIIREEQRNWSHRQFFNSWQGSSAIFTALVLDLLTLSFFPLLLLCTFFFVHKYCLCLDWFQLCRCMC